MRAAGTDCVRQVSGLVPGSRPLFFRALGCNGRESLVATAIGRAVGSLDQTPAGKRRLGNVFLGFLEECPRSQPSGGAGQECPAEEYLQRAGGKAEHSISARPTGGPASQEGHQSEGRNSRCLGASSSCVCMRAWARRALWLGPGYSSLRPQRPPGDG